jgi:L-aminopeptidase/D-esterase-like protein
MTGNYGALSRRSFVRGSLAGVGALAAGGLVGCGSGSTSSSATASSWTVGAIPASSHQTHYPPEFLSSAICISACRQ